MLGSLMLKSMQSHEKSKIDFISRHPAPGKQAIRVPQSAILRGTLCSPVQPLDAMFLNNHLDKTEKRKLLKY